MTVKVDGYTRAVLTIIAVLLTFVVIGLWFETPSSVPVAQAKIPDSGQQLYDLMEKMESVRAATDRVAGVLTSGKAKVQVVDPPSKKVVGRPKSNSQVGP